MCGGCIQKYIKKIRTTLFYLTRHVYNCLSPRYSHKRSLNNDLVFLKASRIFTAFSLHYKSLLLIIRQYQRKISIQHIPTSINLRYLFLTDSDAKNVSHQAQLLYWFVSCQVAITSSKSDSFCFIDCFTTIVTHCQHHGTIFIRILCVLVEILGTRIIYNSSS